MDILSALRDEWRFAPDGFFGARDGKRRRLLVFCAVFVASCTIALVADFMRPPVYRANLLLQINPGSVAVPVHEAQAAPRSDSGNPLLAEVQVLTSRPLLQQAAERLRAAHVGLDALGPDPVDRFQKMLAAKAIDGTSVVDVMAEGERPELLSALLNTLGDAYREQMLAAHDGSSADSVAQTRDEVLKLEADVVAKRREASAFRSRSGIVSAEREENEILSRVKGLGVSINAANERAVAAEARLRSLRESLAGGQSVARAKDNPTLASLEQRVSLAREQQKNMERNFTPEYLAMDPDAKALRAGLQELELQLRALRETSGRSALAEAQEEAASAREAASRLQQQVSRERQSVQQFTVQFDEYKSLQEELAQLEGAYRHAKDRLVRLEASERGRAAGVRVLEAAVAPHEPARPDYARDAALGVAGAIVLALLATWLVEWFNREPPQPTLLVSPAWASAPSMPRLREADRPAALAPPETMLLPESPALPRELADAELDALLRAASADGLVAALALLQGVSPDELIGLRWEHLDLSQGLAHLPGDAARAVPLSDALRGVLAERREGAEASAAPLLHDARGQALSPQDLQALVLCAAHDAGIEAAARVTPQALRHTYLAFLVRQGIRFADLFAIAGRLSGETLAAYSPLSPPGPKLPAEKIDRVLAPVRNRTAG